MGAINLDRLAVTPGNATPALIGPNAIVQTREALRHQVGEDGLEKIFRDAGLSRYLRHPPEDMVEESEVQRLFITLESELYADVAARVAHESGVRTADYLLAFRIPMPAQWLLQHLPATVATPLLLQAIRKHAWTFAGSGTFRTGRMDIDDTFYAEIVNNPFPMPHCPWHQAVFEELFSHLTENGVNVTHPQCCRAGADTCRFVIELRPACRIKEPSWNEA